MPSKPKNLNKFNSRHGAGFFSNICIEHRKGTDGIYTQCLT